MTLTQTMTQAPARKLAQRVWPPLRFVLTVAVTFLGLLAITFVIGAIGLHRAGGGR